MEKNKKEIRREALRRRDGLTAGQRRDYSARIAESLTGLSCYREADAVLAYISFRSEADTFLLLERAFCGRKGGVCAEGSGERDGVFQYFFRS